MVDIAWAAEMGGGSGGGGGLGGMLFPLILIFVIMYFLMIRPQQKKQKQKKEMTSSLKKGDQVVSIGGIHGKVAQVKDATVVLQVSRETKIEISKSAISARLSEGDDADVGDEQAMQEKS